MPIARGDHADARPNPFFQSERSIVQIIHLSLSRRSPRLKSTPTVRSIQGWRRALRLKRSRATASGSGGHLVGASANSASVRDQPASTIETIPMMIKASPHGDREVIQPNRLGIEVCCRMARKNATMPKPKLVIESAVRTHASVVRSRASWSSRKFAMWVRSRATLHPGVVGTGRFLAHGIVLGPTGPTRSHFHRPTGKVRNGPPVGS